MANRKKLKILLRNGPEIEQQKDGWHFDTE